MIKKDARIKIVNEVLNGIKVCTHTLTDAPPYPPPPTHTHTLGSKGEMLLAIIYTRRMQCIVGERERPNLSSWVCKKHIQKPSAHVKETSPTLRQSSQRDKTHNAAFAQRAKGTHTA